MIPGSSMGPEPGAVLLAIYLRTSWNVSFMQAGLLFYSLLCSLAQGKHSVHVYRVKAVGLMTSEVQGQCPHALLGLGLGLNSCRALLPWDS